MTNTQKKAMYARIENHGRRLLAIYPRAGEQDPVKLCKLLRRWESRAHALAERYCNGGIETENYGREEAHILKKVNALLGDTAPAVILNGDPRGCALKIDDADMKNLQARGLDMFRDWGGYGLISPDFSY